MANRDHSYLPVSIEAGRLLGAQIRMARSRRHWSLSDLAERARITKTTALKIERGDPTVGLGMAFDAAVVCGVPLFVEDRPRLSLEVERASDGLALLPKRIRSSVETDDDF
jgi:transcriptional regulator with XRE-family HTH domain